MAGLLQRCSQLEQQACDSKVAAADSLEEVQAQVSGLQLNAYTCSVFCQ